jgi:hypothetical protein
MDFDFFPDQLHLPPGGRRRSPALIAGKYQIERRKHKQRQRRGRYQPADDHHRQWLLLDYLLSLSDRRGAA